MSKKRSKSKKALRRESSIEIIAAVIAFVGTIISGILGVGGNVIADWLTKHPNFWTTAAIVVGGLFLLVILILLGIRLRDAISSRKISDDEYPSMLCPKGGFHDWQVKDTRGTEKHQICKKCGVRKPLD